MDESEGDIDQQEVLREIAAAIPMEEAPLAELPPPEPLAADPVPEEPAPAEPPRPEPLMGCPGRAQMGLGRDRGLGVSP